MERAVDLAEERGGEVIGVEMDVSGEDGASGRSVRRSAPSVGSASLANNADVAPVDGLMELDERTWDLRSTRARRGCGCAQSTSAGMRSVGTGAVA
jgi:hypothetical protein